MMVYFLLVNQLSINMKDIRSSKIVSYLFKLLCNNENTVPAT